MEILPSIKIVSGIVSAVLLVFAIWLIARTQLAAARINEIAEVIRQSGAPKKKVLKEWATITERVKRGGESDLKLAIIEADKLFDDTLKKMGYIGETMADRLKKISPSQLANIEAVWNAHKLRNNIVHTPDFHPSRTDAETAIEIYEKSLREWGLID